MSTLAAPDGPLTASKAHTINDFLRVAHRALPSAIRRKTSWETISHDVPQWPGSLFHSFIYEAHLGDSTHGLDVCVSASRKSARRFLQSTARCEGRHALGEGDDQIDVESPWKPIAAYLQRLNHPDGTLRDGLCLPFWLEFDVDRPASGPQPSAFFGPTHADAERYRSMYVPALEALRGKPLSKEERTLLLDCVEHVPDGSILDQLGVMAARRETLLRLCISDLEPSDVLAYLAAIHWPGDLDRVRHCTIDLHEKAGHTPPCLGLLDVKIGETVYPSVGIEYAFDSTGRSVRQLRDVEVQTVETLQADGLMTRAEADAILDWSGFETVEIPHTEGRHIMLRRLNHVKLSVTDDVTAKAYFKTDFVKRKK